MLYTDFKVSKPTKTFAPVIYGYRPEEDKDIEKFGEMFAIMSLESDMEFELERIGGLLFDELQRAYFEQEIATPDFKHFEDSLYSLHKRLETIIEREPDLAEQGVDVELVVCVVKQGAMYVASVGEASVFIYRDGELAEVASSLIDARMDGFMKTGSMELQQEDRILLLNSKAAAVNTQNNLSRQMSDVQVKDLAVEQGAALLVGYGINEDWLEQKQQREEEAAEAAKTTEIEGKDQDTQQEQAFMEKEAVAQADDQQTVVNQEETSSTETEQKQEIVDGNQLEQETKESKPIQEDVSADESTKREHTTRKEVMQEEEKQLSSSESGIQAEDEEAAPSLLNRAQYFVTKVGSQVSTSLSKVRASLFSNKARSNAATGFPIHRGNNYVQKVKDIFNNIKRGSKGDRLQLKQFEFNWRLLGVVVLVLVLAIFFGVRQLEQNRRFQEQMQDLEAQVANLETRWKGLSSDATTAAVNLRNIDRRQSVLQNLEGFIQETEKAQDNEVITDAMSSKLANLQEEAEDAVLDVAGVDSFTEPQLITDFAAAFEGATPREIAYTDGEIYTVDQAKGALYKTGTSLNSSAVPVLEDLDSPYLIDKDEDGNLVIVDENEDTTIGTYDLDQETFTRHPGLSQSRVGSLQAIDVWTNASLYSLNTNKQAIVRQANLGGDYQVPNYAIPWREDPQFANAVDMQVDYWIYVLVEDEGLKRYLSGEPAEYELRGVLPEDKQAMNNLVAIETSERHIFLADEANQQIYQFDKDMNDSKYFDFAKKYRYAGEGNTFTDIKDLVFNASANQLYVLDGTSLVRLDL